MPWLVRDGEVLATLEVASTFGQRLRGLLGRDGLDGALLIEKTKSVHTVAMRFPVDVAYLDSRMTVFDVVAMRRWRAGRPRLRARAVLEAEAGAFERWRLRPGDHLEIKG